MLVNASGQSGLPLSKDECIGRLGEAPKVALATDSAQGNKIVGVLALKNKLTGDCTMSEIGFLVVAPESRGQRIPDHLLTELKTVIQEERSLKATYAKFSVTNYPSLSKFINNPNYTVAGYFKGRYQNKITVVLITPEKQFTQLADTCNKELRNYFKSSSDVGQFTESIEAADLQQAIDDDQFAQTVIQQNQKFNGNSTAFKIWIQKVLKMAPTTSTS